MKTLYMKSTYLFMVFAMILGFTLTGCSDDNSGDPSTSAEFPELKEFTCNAGETKDLSFTAGADWALSSNAGWCKFKNGEFTESTISGKAGSQTVQVVITNDGQNFEKDDIAELTLKMGNSSQVICKITRPHKIPVDIVITDEEGNVYDAEHPIIIKGSAPLSLVETVITVETDFEVGLPEYPDWVAVNAKGNGVYALSFKDDNKSGISNKYMLQHTECLPNARITPDENNDINIEYIVQSRTGTTKRAYIFLGTLNNYNMLHTNILKLDEGSTWYEDDTDIFNQDATWSVDDSFYLFKDGVLLVTPTGTNSDTLYCYNIVDSKVVSVETAGNISNSGTDYSLTRYRLKFTDADHNIYCVKGTSTTREFGLIPGDNLYPLGSMSAYDNLKATNFKNMILLLAPGNPNIFYGNEILNLKSQGMINVTWPDWGETKKSLYADPKLFLWKFLFPYHRIYDFNYPLLNHPLILPYNLSMDEYDWYLEVTIKKPPTNVFSYCILGNGFKFSDNDETPIAKWNTGISIEMNNADDGGFTISNYGYMNSQWLYYSIYEGVVPNKDYTTVSIRYDQDTSSKKSNTGHLVDVWIDGSPVDYTPSSNLPSTWNDNIGCFECILVHSINIENNHVYTDNEDLGQIEINFGPNWKYPDLAQGLLDKDEDIIDDTKVDYTLTIQGTNSRVQISKDMPTSLPNTTVTFKVRVSATYTEGGEVANIGTSYFLDSSGNLVNTITPPTANYCDISFNKNQTDDTYLAFDITYNNNSSTMFGSTDSWTFPKTFSNQDLGDITLTDKYNNSITLEVRADYTFTGLDYQITSFEITGTNTFSGDAGKAIPIYTTGKAYFTDVTPFLNGSSPYSTTFLSMTGYGSGFTVTSINVTSVSNDDNSVSFSLSASYTNSNSGTFYINSDLRSIDKWGGSKSCHEDRIITINIEEKQQIQYIKQNVFKNHNFLLKDVSGGGLK